MATRPRASRTDFSSDLLPLFEYSNVINSSIDLKFILNTVLLTVMGKLLVSKGMVLLRRDESQFEVFAAKGVANDLLGQSIKLTKPPKTILSFATLNSRTGIPSEFFENHGQRLLIPILVRRDVVGYLSVGERVAGKRYSAAERKLVQSLVNLSGAAIEKAMMLDQLKVANRDIDRKYQELNTLFELGREFNVVFELQKVVRLLTFSLLGQVGVNRYVVCLREGAAMKVAASRIEEGPELTQAIQDLGDLENASLTHDLLRQKKWKDAAGVLVRFSVKVLIPMRVQSQTKGLILLGDKLRGGDYTKADLEFLYSLGNLAIISIENARLFQETLEKQRMEEELKLAREIQQGLLPLKLPEIAGFDLAAVNVSSKQVGGDYYDVVRRSENEHVIAIGDVSGKGAPAALLMANVQAALRALAPMNYSLSDATARLNDLTFLNTGQGRFITFFWGVLDVSTGHLRYVNAGHNPPFLLRSDGSIERLDQGGLILGIMKTVAPYIEGNVDLKHGDTLFMFTDGVSEAMNEKGIDFTEERLEKVIHHAAGLPPGEIIRHVQSEIEAHTKGTAQSDDITMFVVKAL